MMPRCCFFCSQSQSFSFHLFLSFYLFLWKQRNITIRVYLHVINRNRYENYLNSINFAGTRSSYLVSMSMMTMEVMVFVMIVVVMFLMNDRHILLFCVMHRFVNMHWCVVFNFDRSWVNFWYFHWVWNVFDNWDMNSFLHWHWDVMWYFYFICSNRLGHHCQF